MHSHLQTGLSTLLFSTLLLTAFPALPAFTTAGYFPLPDSATWDYIDSYPHSYSSQVVGGTFPINGVATKRLQHSTGDSEFFTNDANGISMHAIEYTLYSTMTRTKFEPPIRMAYATADIGDRLNSSGLADMHIPDVGQSYPINYSSTGIFAAEEQVTVPFGTFDTVRFVFTFRIWGYVYNGYLDENFTRTLWQAPGAGVVRRDDSQYGIWELVDTNVASLLPTVTIDFPASGATLASDFNLQFTISNWTVAPGDSHLHWFLDGADQGPRYDLSPIPVSGLSNGPHSISLQLANADHTYTGVEDTVAFTFDNRSTAAAITGIVSTILLSD